MKPTDFQLLLSMLNDINNRLEALEKRESDDDIIRIKTRTTPDLIILKGKKETNNKLHYVHIVNESEFEIADSFDFTKREVLVNNKYKTE